MKKKSAAPMSEEEFAAAWDGLLRAFLMVANDADWANSQKHLAGPSPLAQPFWSDAGTGHHREV